MRPLEGNYGATLTVALLALIPFIVITTAYQFYRTQITFDIGASATDVEVIFGLATAGYAFGALLAGDLIQRFAQRTLFFFCESTFVVGSVLAATAPHVPQFGVGVAIEGLATGLLLVVALPPVIRNFPPERLPFTAAFIDLGFFGAVAVGPLVGGALGAAHAWRWLYAALAAIGLLTLVTATLTLPKTKPQNPGQRFDREGVLLGFLGTALPFFAASNLTMQGLLSAWFLVPFTLGALCFLALLFAEYHMEEPISPVKAMWNTLPVVGVIASMIGGGAYITFYVLIQQLETDVQLHSPLNAGLLYWPQIVGVVVSSALLNRMLRTKYLPFFTFAGMFALLVAGALLLDMRPAGSTTLMLIAFFFLGLGAGATVAPGLWMASLSLQSKMVGRIFALVELIRSEANFLMAPIVLKIALVLSGGPLISMSGFHAAIYITLGISVLLTMLGTIVFIAGAPGLQRPDLRRWLKDDKPAWTSPELLAPVRGVHPQQQAQRKAS